MSSCYGSEGAQDDDRPHDATPGSSITNEATGAPSARGQDFALRPVVFDQHTSVSDQAELTNNVSPETQIIIS